MPLNLTLTRSEAFNRLVSDFLAELSEINPLLRNSFERGLLVTLAGRISELNQQQQSILVEMFPDSAQEEDFIARWGSYRSISRLAATQASGLITATGTPGSLIPSGSILTTASGASYQTTASASIAINAINVTLLTRTGQTATIQTVSSHGFASNISIVIAGADQSEYNGTFLITVTGLDTFEYTIVGTPATPATGTITATGNAVSLNVQSDSFGIAGNVGSGGLLRFSSPVAGVDNEAFVQFSEIVGGVDIEPLETFRERVLDAYQNPISEFSDAAITQIIRQNVPGVDRVFIFGSTLPTGTPQPGFVTIFFTMIQSLGVIPNAQNIADVRAAVDSIRPAFVPEDSLEVLAPTPLSTNFTIQNLQPSTTTMQSAVVNNLQQFFNEEVLPSQVVREFSYNAAVTNTIDLETNQQIQNFVIGVPAGDIIPGFGELPTLGTVIFI